MKRIAYERTKVDCVAEFHELNTAEWIVSVALRPLSADGEAPCAQGAVHQLIARNRTPQS